MPGTVSPLGNLFRNFICTLATELQNSFIRDGQNLGLGGQHKEVEI